jgi:cobalt-precorrin 5A hydrolase
MAGLIAIGIGCREAATGDAIVALVRDALAKAGTRAGKPRLFTIESKRGAANVAAAAAALGWELSFLDRAQLQAQVSRAMTRSERVARHIGLPSVAETAALAGAGEGGRLVVPRLAADGATCAIAHNPGAPE